MISSYALGAGCLTLQNTAFLHPVRIRRNNLWHATSGAVSGPSNTLSMNANIGVIMTSALARRIKRMVSSGETSDFVVSGLPAAGSTRRCVKP